MYTFWLLDEDSILHHAKFLAPDRRAKGLTTQLNMRLWNTYCTIPDFSNIQGLQRIKKVAKDFKDGEIDFIFLKNADH